MGREPESTRRLTDLVSVGPRTAEDLALLGISTVDELARSDPGELFARLQRLKGGRLDPCCADVLCAAVAQARDPFLPEEMRRWPYWSKLRKAAPESAGGRADSSSPP
ncbi:MAG: mitomycin resistance protein [Candidatus Dadabacteria bacterium]|nr:MAG: mitomycin resistance protein [Candidatus Dadabacteria bacterium]